MIAPCLIRRGFRTVDVMTLTAAIPATRTSDPGPVLPAALLGAFLIILDTSAVNVGLNSIGHDLGGGMSGLQWVVDAYALLFGALMLSAGALSDRIGARRAMTAGLVGFTLASVACGLAPGLVTLIGARVVQGATAAVIMPTSLALIRQGYVDQQRRARAIGIWAAGGASAFAAGPVVGGLLASAWSWRGIFLINIPVGLVGVLLLSRTQPSPRRAAALDLPGQVTAVTALLALTFTVIEGGKLGYAARPVVASLAVALVSGLAFLMIEARASQPMLPLSLFRSTTASLAIGTGFALNGSFYGMVFVLGLYFQQDLALSPLAAGVLFLPLAAAVTAMNLLSSRIVGRFGARVPIVTGQLVMALGLLGLLIVDGPALALMLIPVGLGAATVLPVLTSVLLDSVEADRAGLAAGVFSAVRQIGGGLAIALFGSLAVNLGSLHAGLAASVLVGTATLLVSVAATVTVGLAPRRRPAPA